MGSRPQPQMPAAALRPRHTPSQRPTKKRRRRVYERRIRLLTLCTIGPALLAAVLLIAFASWSLESKLGLIAVLLLASLIFEAILHDQVIRPLQTLSNVVSSLREEDYSFRARGAAPNDALGELAQEVNALADTLADQRTHAVEATELLRRMVEEIDVPLFTFDPADKLRLVNSAGARLLQQTPAKLLGRGADEIGLTPYLRSSSESVASPSPLNPNSRWLMRRSSFRQKGVPHTLIVLSDVSLALREEERSAWQRLIRVLGHELNNSLTPIKSIAGTLTQRLADTALEAAERTDFEKGLSIIESRAASLNRFLQAYRKLAQMPLPALKRVPLRALLERVAALEMRTSVAVAECPDIPLVIDPDQFEQMLINVTRNAVEAALDGQEAAGPLRATQPEVKLSAEVQGANIFISVVDNGPGLLNPENTFVPFYTTKPGGSGIGLVLSRQIVEAHGGSIVLENRRDGRGCAAKITVPLWPAEQDLTGSAVN